VGIYRGLGGMPSVEIYNCMHLFSVHDFHQVINYFDLHWFGGKQSYVQVGGWKPNRT